MCEGLAGLGAKSKVLVCLEKSSPRATIVFVAIRIAEVFVQENDASTIRKRLVSKEVGTRPEDGYDTSP
jgi:hypothetical protein